MKIGVQILLVNQFKPIQKSLHRCFTFAALTLMGALIIVFLKPVVKITLQILVDRPSVEVCGNDGRIYITSPRGQEENKGVAVFAKGGAVKLTSLVIHELKSVWPKR